MAAHRNTVTGGIDCDTSPAFVKQDRAYMIKNGSIISEEQAGIGAVSNIKGNELSFIVPDLDDANQYTDPFNTGVPELSDIKVIGNTNLRNEIVLFSTDEDGVPNGSYGQIWTLKYDHDDQVEWVHDLIQVGANPLVLRKWDYGTGPEPENQIDGNLFDIDDTLVGVGDQVLITRTYTDTTPNPDVVLTKGEIWKFVSNGVWEKVLDLNILKNKITIANTLLANLIEPVLGIWDIYQNDNFPPGIQDGDRYMSDSQNNGIGVYSTGGTPHWEVTPYPGNGLYSVYNTGNNVRYYSSFNGWTSTPLSALNQEYVWIGTDKTYLDFEGYISGWHLFYTNTLMPGVHMKYINQLDFSQKYRIKAIGNVEDEDIGKVYWVDGYNVIRHLNLYDPLAYSTPVNQIDVISNVEFSQVHDQVVIGGVYKPGVVQHSYQLYKKNGPETSFSPSSDLVSLTSSSFNDGDDTDFNGDKYIDPNVLGNTGKAVKVTIHDIDTNFEYIKVCSIYYDLLTATPIISLVYDGIIPQSRTLVHYDSGAVNLRTYTVEEFNMIGGMYIRPKDVETKDNRLIVANYKEQYFDVDYDARSLAWAHEGATFAANIYDDINGGFITYNDPSELSTVVENSDFYYDTSTHHYKYNADQTTNDWGGTGINVSYEIKLYTTIIDEDRERCGEGAKVYGAYNKQIDIVSELKEQQNDPDDPTFISGDSYTSYAGDLVKSQLVGYQRAEKYRFGVIFIDIKGRRSPVKWIADIVMPSANDFNTSVTYSIGGIDYHDFAPFVSIETPTAPDKNLDKVTTYANIMYVKFTLNNIPSDAISYQIVRMERKEEDTSIVASGYVVPTSTWYIEPAFDPGNSPWAPFDNIVCDSVFRTGNITLHPIGSLLDFNMLHDWNPGFSDNNNSLEESMGASHLDVPGCAAGFVHERSFDHAFEFMTPDIIFSRTPVPTDSTLIVTATSLGWGFCNNDLNDADPPQPDIALNRDTFIKIYGYVGDAPKSITIEKSIFPTSDWYETRNNGYILPDGNRYAPYCTRKNDGTDPQIDSQYKQHNSKKGLCLIGYVGAGTSLATELGGYGYSDQQFIYGYIKITLASQYGGNTYNVRLGNEYIEASHIYPVASNSANTFGGDTYISMFEYNRVFADLELEWQPRNEYNDNSGKHKDKTAYAETVIMPIESRYCLDYRSDKTRTQEVIQGASYLMQEKAGSWEADNKEEVPSDIFVQDTDLYIYNPVYSKQQSVRRHYTQFIFEVGEDNEAKYDARIAISELKINNQRSDSWLKFLPNNYLDVTYNYGPIAGIKELNDGILFFQQKAVGFIPINEQALFQAGDSPSLISLGVGSLLGKPQYISTTNGTIHRDAILKANSGVYFYDEINNDIFMLNKPMTPMTSVKGINTYLRNNVDPVVVDFDETILGQGVSGGYDQKNGRLYWSFGRLVGGNTVIYNEKLAGFETVLTINPYLYISDKNRLISSGHWNGETPDPSVGKNFYLHDVGDYGKFYGEVMPFSVEFIINPEYPFMKVFDNFEFTFKCPSDQTVFFDNYYLTSEYGIDTGNYTAANSRFRFLKWRTNVPRVDNARAFGNSIQVRFQYNNGDNFKVELSDLITHYRIHGMPFN